MLKLHKKLSYYMYHGYKCKILNVLQKVNITPYRSPLPEALDAGRINILKSVMYFPFFYNTMTKQKLCNEQQL